MTVIHKLFWATWLVSACFGIAYASTPSAFLQHIWELALATNFGVFIVYLAEEFEDAVKKK